LTKPDYGGFRQFLDLDSPLRQRQFIIDGQTYMFRDVEERPPPTRRTDESAAEYVALATPGNPFRGHKALPFLISWQGVNWEASICDLMHDMKRFGEMTLKVLVGKGSHGMYKRWKKTLDARHRVECELHEIFPEMYMGGDHDTNKPPWRLSPDAVRTLDKRVRNIWWPHYMDPVCFNGVSFWLKSNRFLVHSNF
jgi:hypothetical protein